MGVVILVKVCIIGVRVGVVLVCEMIDSPRRERTATRCGASAPERGDLSAVILDNLGECPQFVK